MRFDVLTLFPELFDPFLRVGVTRRAYESKQVDVRLWQLRDHAEDNYRRVDDRPFGGGPGMVMLAAPLERALAAVTADRATTHPGAPAVIHFSPTGRKLDQALARELAQGEGAILLCGRYEGIDQRVLDRHVTMEISPGDFVLSGHHAEIARWRREQSLALTQRRRPELIEAARRDGKLDKKDEKFLAALQPAPSKSTGKAPGKTGGGTGEV